MLIRIGDVTYRTVFANIEPDLEGDDWDGFKHSIEDRGILMPIRVDNDRNVLDGRQRLRAAADLRLPQEKVPVTVETGLTLDDKVELWWRLNLIRQHLTPEQKATLRQAAKDRGEQSGGNVST